MTLALIMIAGAAGAVLRDEVIALVHRVNGRRGSRGPIPALMAVAVVNLSGAFALGALVGAGVGGLAFAALGPGLASGYTTYSAWMVESALVSPRIRWANVALQAAGGVGLAALGAALGALVH